jgi:hypothetical protein
MRNKDIAAVLKHVEIRRQELFNLTFDSRIKKVTVDNIANLVADILSNLTKCFDYCAQDLFDQYILPNENYRGKIYFPFYEKQLNDKKQPFYLLLKYQKQALYQFLLEIVKKADRNEYIENTIIPYSIAREVRSLVNSDKHNKIVAIDDEGPTDLLVTSEIGQIIIKSEQLNQQGWKTEVFPGSSKTEVISKSYRFIENNQDVLDFCSLALWNTQQVLNSIYRKFLMRKTILTPTY